MLSSNTSGTVIPREVFEFGRCIVHFAVDDPEVRFCTHFKGRLRGSCRLTRDRMTAREIPLTRGVKNGLSLERDSHAARPTDIIENYAQIVERRDPKTGKTKRDQMFPRYHQLDVVLKLLADARSRGAGRRGSSSIRRAVAKGIQSVAGSPVGAARQRRRRSSIR